MNKVLLFNPRATDYKPRIPNSILAIAASIQGITDYVIVDGNLEADPGNKIEDYLSTGLFSVFACTVMPGPQLQQAIPVSKQIRERFPQIKIVWGGYFPSNHSAAVLNSGLVDVVVDGMGDKCFPLLLDAFKKNKDISQIKNLIYISNGEIIRTYKDELIDPDQLPSLPYEKLNLFYPLEKYLGKSYLGTRTIAYHSSFGCPFGCSFCAVVPIYNARWKGKSAEKIYKDIKYMKDHYGADAIEFHDNNFFVSEKRSVEFARLIMSEHMTWWGEGRIDTIDKYSDESLQHMRESGCKMIFFGAETGNDQLLKQLSKGGTQSASQILNFSKRMRSVDIIPEFSFVLGFPGPDEQSTMKMIEDDISFIRNIKDVNSDAEIIIYVYSPVPAEGTVMYEKVKASGFKFPESLEDWLAPEWLNFDLRKNPMTPWLTSAMIDKIKDFETVLNGYYPTVSDICLSPGKRRLMKALASYRYQKKFYTMPYEIKILQKLWKYRQPENQGF